MPPDIAVPVATLALIVVSAGLAGIGKLMREKGWDLTIV